MKRMTGLRSLTIACLLWGATFPAVYAETPRINLQNTDIRALVETVARLTGKNFILDPAVRGNITFVSGEGLSEDDLYEAFLSILQVQGYEAIEAGNIIKIVPINKGRAQVAPIVPGQGADQPNIDVDETITQVFKLQYIPAQTAIGTLQQLAGQGGETRLQFNPSSNSIIVTGRGQNVARLGEIISSIDQPNNQDFELVALKHSVATQLAATLRELMSTGAAGADGVALPQSIRISVDQRTNSIIVAGDKADRERMRKVIERLDIPRTQPSDTIVVPLKHAVAAQMLQSLNALQIVQQGAEGTPAPKQVRLSIDERTNSMIVAGDQTEREPILSAIARLDVPGSQPSDTVVIPLKYAVATQLLTTLNALQIGKAAEGAPAIKQARMAADERTNSILISGDKTDREPIMAAIAKLDTPRAQSGGTRVVPLRYAKAEDIVKVLTDTSKGIQQQTAGTAEGAPAVAASSSGGSDISIQADKGSNSIVITAPDHIQKNLLKVIYQLDRRRAQVLVEAIIAEVSNDISNKLGFGVAAANNNRNLAVTSNTTNGGLSSLLSLATGGTTVPNGLLLAAASNNFGLVLDALKGDGATNILSTPTLVTMDNEEASIIVGQNVPFVTGSYTSGTSGGTAENPFQTIQRQDVGLTLKVTPQINRGKTIQMKIIQEVSSIATSAASASDVITNKRSIDTNVMVEDGQVLVLGGLIQDNFTDSESKVPVLSDLPVIGAAFKQSTTTKTKQNLMVFIHPVIMPDREAADAYTRNKYHTLQKQQKESQILQRGNRINGQAAVFPDIECIDGSCGEGSADDLHFPAPAVAKRPITQAQQPALTQQQRQQQAQAQQRQQQAQRQVQQQQPVLQQTAAPANKASTSSFYGGRREPGECVPGFCQIDE